MGTTAHYGWPYPDPNDPIAQGADSIRALAEDIETTSWEREHVADAVPLGDHTTGSVGSYAQWGTPVGLGTPVAGVTYRVVALVTGAVNFASASTSRRRAAVRLELDRGDGAWDTTLGRWLIELHGNDQRAAGVAHSLAETFVAAGSQVLRVRAVVAQLDLGSSGDLSYVNGVLRADRFVDQLP